MGAGYYFSHPHREEARLLWSSVLGDAATLFDMTADGQYLIVARNMMLQNGSILSLYDRTGRIYWNYGLRDSVSRISVSPFGNSIAAVGHSLYKFDTNGHLTWQRDVNRTPEAIAALENGEVIAATTDSLMLLGRNGEPDWTTSLPNAKALGPVGASPQFVAASCPSSSECIVYLVNPDGLMVWGRLVEEPIASIFADVSFGRIVVGTSTSEVYLLDFQGNPLWSAKTPAPVVAVSTSADGVFVLAVSRNGIAYSFDISGTLVGLHDISHDTIQQASLSQQGIDVAVETQARNKNWLGFLEITSPATIPTIPQEQIILIALSALAVSVLAFGIYRKRSVSLSQG